MGKRGLSLEVRLVLATALLVLSTAAVITVLSTLQQRQTLRAQLEDDARLLLAGLSVGAPEALADQRADLLAAQAGQFQSTPQVLFIRYYDTAGRTLVDSGAPAGPGPETDPFAQRLLSGDVVVLDWRTDQLVAGQPVYRGSQLAGAVSAVLSTAAIDATLATTGVRGLLVALAAAIVGVVLALVVSRPFSSQLREIVSAMKQVAQGNWPEQMVARPSAEIHELVGALKEMTVGLQDRVAREGGIVKAIFEGIISVDHHGHIIACNPAAQRMFGYSQAQMLQLMVPQLIVQWSLQKKPRRDLASYLATGDGTLFNRTIEAVAVRADGRQFSIEWAITRISPTDPPVFAVIIHDISERKRAEEDLRRAKDAAEAASRSKSTFLANMSHELRTPLNAILGYSELLQDEARDSEMTGLAADLSKIHESASNLLAVISRVLDYSKIEAGRMELQLESFDIGTLVGEVVNVSRALAVRNGNRLQVEYPPDIGTMVADRAKVQQVLLHLLGNAAKFTTNGTIRLSVSRGQDQGAEQICFQVADTGIGVTAEQMPSLFQAFTQADASIAQRYGGSGLGLAISQSYCQLMGGKITVQSAPDQGATFTVTLPSEVSARGGGVTAAGEGQDFPVATVSP